MPRSPAVRINCGALSANVAMYRDHWARCGFDPLLTQNQFERIPLIGKQQLRDAGIQGRLDARYARARNSVERSGGSSGEPVDTLIDAGSRRRRQWRFLKALLAVGYRPGFKLWIVSTHRSSRMNTLLRWTYLDMRDSEQALSARYLSERPQVLYGPVRALLSMAQELPQTGAAHRPRVLIATAELLRPEDQRALRDAFGIEAADFYGMTEIGLFAYRRAGETQYRVVANDVLAEYLPATDPALERLVVTTLRECAMPLVRYDTGDLVRRDHTLPHKPIIEFVGREIDGVLLPSGKRLSPYRIVQALEAMRDIGRYQVVQREDRSVDVLLQTSSADAQAVRERARLAVTQLLGPELSVRAGELGTDAHPKAEKFRAVRSYAR